MLSFLNALSPLILRSVPIDVPKKEMVFDKNNKGKQVKSNKFTGISKLERRVRTLLERHYGVQFCNVRLPFMRNPITGRLLELDLYCEQLHLAIEVSGVQHRSSSSHFYKEREGASVEQQFQLQKQRDQMKLKLCQENGIKLIIIHDNKITSNMMDDEVLNLVLNRIAFG